MGGKTLIEGDIITIDGLLARFMKARSPSSSRTYQVISKPLRHGLDAPRRMTVRANAETPLDTQKARHFGAEGIGLCRTEHMFFDADRIIVMRQMIMSDDKDGRTNALQKLLPMQQADFEELFEIMSGLPVTIRLLDPPLHEFLPHSDEEMADVAKASGISLDVARQRALKLHEANPMLGHRGCRLAISYPEICEMQARAIPPLSLWQAEQMPLCQKLWCHWQAHRKRLRFAAKSLTRQQRLFSLKQASQLNILSAQWWNCQERPC